MSIKKSDKWTEVAPNVYKATDRSYYIESNGQMKFVIKERLDKLLERAGGNYETLVQNYRARQRKQEVLASTEGATVDA